MVSSHIDSSISAETDIHALRSENEELRASLQRSRSDFALIIAELDETVRRVTRDESGDLNHRHSSLLQTAAMLLLRKAELLGIDRADSADDEGEESQGA